MKRFHYLYRIINIENGKEYIGVHSTDDMDDGYFGSGIYLRKAIQKHGRSNFRKEIIALFDSRNEALKRERELVSPEYIRRDDVYNLVIGGGAPRHRKLTYKKFAHVKEGDISEKKEVIFNIDIDSNLRCEFYADEDQFMRLASATYLNWIYHEQKEREGEKHNTLSNVRYRMAEIIRTHLADYCSIMTKHYNDSRHHKYAMNLLTKNNQYGMLGTAIKVRPLTIETWQ